MVKIPERPWAGLTVGRIEPPSLNSSSFFASLGSASEKIVSAARIIRSQREHDRLTEAQNAYEEAVGQWTGQLRDNRQGGSASGCTREFLERHSDIVGETTRRMRENGVQKETSEAFANWSESRAKETLGRIAGFEHEQMQRHGLAVHEQRVTNLGAKLERDPESYADTLGQLEECFTLAVGQGLFSPQQARERFAGVRPLLQ